MQGPTFVERVVCGADWELIWSVANYSMNAVSGNNKTAAVCVLLAMSEKIALHIMPPNNQTCCTARWATAHRIHLAILLCLLCRVEGVPVHVPPR